jgi:pilus assembly protein CpaB
MSMTRIAVLALAIGSAVIAAFLARGFLGQPPTREVVEVNKVAQTDILVATQDVRMGEKLSSGNMTWQNWPDSAVRPYMIKRTDKPQAIQDLENGRARTNIYEGEPISDAKIIEPNTAGFMAAILPKGMKAISVRISAETGAGGFILPNDRVDVIVTTKKSAEGSSKTRSVSETVLMNVRVLAIDQTFQTNDKGEQVVVGKTATLELDQRQAEVLAMAESAGQLTLLLRSLADRGDGALGDDGPRLSDRYAKGGRGGEISVFRYGIESLTGLSK